MLRTGVVPRQPKLQIHNQHILELQGSHSKLARSTGYEGSPKAQRLAQQSAAQQQLLPPGQPGKQLASTCIMMLSAFSPYWEPRLGPSLASVRLSSPSLPVQTATAAG